MDATDTAGFSTLQIGSLIEATHVLVALSQIKFVSVPFKSGR